MDQSAPQSAGFYNFLGWVETNKKRVAMGAGAVVFVALAIGVIVWRSGEKQIEAEEALAAVRMPYSPLEQPAPGTAEALVKVAAEYPGTPAAAKALLRAGTVYFDVGNYAKAQEQFESYLRNFGETPSAKDAVFGIAVCLEASGKSTEAITKYKDFVGKYETDPVADMARFNLARLYEQSNQPQLALDILNKMAGTGAPNMPPSPSSQEARAKIQAIYAKNPALMPPPPVSPAPAPQATVTPVQQRPLVLKPEEPPTQPAPKVIVNPSTPTPGQPNPAGTAPKIIVNPSTPTPAPAQPAPAK